MVRYIKKPFLSNLPETRLSKYAVGLTPRLHIVQLFVASQGAHNQPLQ